MKRTATFTHTGWFGICPVYIGDPDGDARLTPRVDNDFYEFLFQVSAYAFHAAFWVMDLVHPDNDVGYPLMITGQLLVPYHYEYEERDL